MGVIAVTKVEFKEDVLGVLVDVDPEVVIENLGIIKRVVRQDKEVLAFVDLTPEEIAAAEAEGRPKKVFALEIGPVYVFLTDAQWAEHNERAVTAARRRADPLSKFTEKPMDADPMKVVASMEGSFNMPRALREVFMSLLPADSPTRLLAERIEAEVVRRGVRAV